MPKPRKAELPIPKEDRSARFARIQAEESNRKYAAYLETLDPRERERLPQLKTFNF